MSGPEFRLKARLDMAMVLEFGGEAVMAVAEERLDFAQLPRGVHR